MAEGRNTLTAYDASEGALYVLFALVACLHPRSPAILAIDNVDHALNPQLARALMGKICDWTMLAGQRQLFLTCHNPVALDGLPLQDDAVRLFTVQRSNTGRSVVDRVVVTDRMRKLAKEGYTLSRMWVIGEIGGVPNV